MPGQSPAATGQPSPELLAQLDQKRRRDALLGPGESWVPVQLADGRTIYARQPAAAPVAQYVPANHPPGPAPEGYFDAAIAHRAPIIFQLPPGATRQADNPLPVAHDTLPRTPLTPAAVLAQQAAIRENQRRLHAELMARPAAASNMPLLLGAPTGGRY